MNLTKTHSQSHGYPQHYSEHHSHFDPHTPLSRSSSWRARAHKYNSSSTSQAKWFRFWKVWRQMRRKVDVLLQFLPPISWRTVIREDVILHAMMNTRIATHIALHLFLPSLSRMCPSQCLPRSSNMWWIYLCIGVSLRKYMLGFSLCEFAFICSWMWI